MPDWLLASIGEILAGLVLAALAWVLSSIRDLRREIAESNAAADARLDAVERQAVKAEELERHNVIDRLNACERQLAAMTTAEDLNRIHSRIDKLGSADGALASGIGELKGLVESQSGQLELIQSYLLRNGDGK